jgi:hypothetical protein
MMMIIIIIMVMMKKKIIMMKKKELQTETPCKISINALEYSGSFRYLLAAAVA